MFSLSARFRKSRTAGAPGSVYYIIRRGGAERNITGTILYTDESVLSREKERIAFDLMTIYCVIESLSKDGTNPDINLVYDAAMRAILHENPYATQIRDITGKYPVRDDIARIAKLFSDRFERHKRVEDAGEAPTSSLSGYFSHLTQEYVDEGKPFAKSLRSTRRSLDGYPGGNGLMLKDVDVAFITGYAQYLSDRVSPDTVSFYMRTLRTVLRRAESEGLLSSDFEWPATVRTGVSRNAGKPVGGALSINTIRNIERMDLSSDKSLELARDIFMFGFYAQGMELNDVANLKAGNIDGRTLTYKRRQKGKERTVVLGDKAMAIIEKYRNDSRQYLFPIIQRKWMLSYTSARNEVADSLNKIGQRLDPPIKLTFSMNSYSWQAIIKSANLAEMVVL